MALRRATRASRTLSMTSLIDVIFLLLLFFMLSTSFSRFVEIPIANSSPSGEFVNDSDTLIFVVELGKGITRLNREDVLAEDINDMIAAQINDRALIYIAARDGLTTDELVSAFNSLAQIDNAQVSFLDDSIDDGGDSNE